MSPGDVPGSLFLSRKRSKNVLICYLQVQSNGQVPPARGGHASVAVGTKVIVFGGANRAAAPFTDLWVLETGKLKRAHIAMSSEGSRIMG